MVDMSQYLVLLKFVLVVVIDLALQLVVQVQLNFVVLHQTVVQLIVLLESQLLFHLAKV